MNIYVFLCSHSYKDGCGLNFGCVGCCLHAFVRVEVDCRHHCASFFFKLLSSLHCAIEVLLDDQ